MASGQWTAIKNTITILPQKDTVDTNFLFRILDDEDSWHIRGAGQPFITLGDARNRDVKLPPLLEQRRIAEILDKADGLRAKRREALAHLDSLAQSIFLEMFGDPVMNLNNWKRAPFSTVLENIDSGWSPVCLDRPVTGDEWGVLKLGAVTRCEYKPTENKSLPTGVAPDPSIEVKPGDLLFTRKNTYELVAACAFVEQTPPRLLLSDLLFRFRIRPDAEVDARFLQQQLTYPTKRRTVQQLAGGSAGSMPNISKTKLLQLEIELPPLKLQKEFRNRIAKIGTVKNLLNGSLTELDSLFASLQHHAFQGAL